jgi:hypothetical protein
MIRQRTGITAEAAAQSGRIGQRARSHVAAEYPRTYPVTFFAWALTFAHRFFVAFEIAALPAADKTRFLTTPTSRSTEWPKAPATAM